MKVDLARQRGDVKIGLTMGPTMRAPIRIQYVTKGKIKIGKYHSIRLEDQRKNRLNLICTAYLMIRSFYKKNFLVVIIKPHLAMT